MMDDIYNLEGRVPFKKAVPIGLQHVMAMFVANITPIIILAGILDFDAEFKANLVQNAMMIAGLGTLVQLFPVWKIGARLPIVMGVSFTFLSVAISVSTTYGYGTMMCAVIVGGIVEGLIGLFAKYWIKIITPVIAATIVTAIGFSLLPIGTNSFMGGAGCCRFRFCTKLDCRFGDSGLLHSVQSILQRILQVNIYPFRACCRIYPGNVHGHGGFQCS